MTDHLDKSFWGLVEESVLQRIVVVSPHFDDAALGVAHVLGTYPKSTVVTVMAGWPPSYPDEPTDWDACGGFVAGDDVVAARRQEDVAALEVFDASHIWLEVPDHQYLTKAQRQKPAEVAPAIKDAIEQVGPTAVFFPMGIANPDHVLTHDACLIARSDLEARAGTGKSDKSSAPEWFCYEDHGYKHIPGLLAWRVAKLFKAGLWPTPSIVPIKPDMALKRRAIHCYKSQIGPLERDHALSERLDGNVPEQYWRIAPPPEGWEALADSI
jgi:LmbE family N-acetylglucosaminyl deacetylase